jgi:hypothetical protein
MKTDFTDPVVLADRVIFDIARVIGERLTGEGTPAQTRLLVHDIELLVVRHANRTGLITEGQMTEFVGMHKARAAEQAAALA